MAEADVGQVEQGQQQGQQGLLNAHTAVAASGVGQNEASRQQVAQMQQMWDQVSQLSQSNDQLRSVVAGMINQKATPQTPEDEELSPIELELRNLKEAMGYLTQYLSNDRDTRAQNTQELLRQHDLAEMKEVSNYVEQSVATLDSVLEENGYPYFAQYRSLVRSAIENDPAWYQARSREEVEALLVEASDPRTWARVYVESIVPTLAQFAPELKKHAINRADHPEYNNLATATEYNRAGGVW